MQVKICGLTTPESVEAAVQAGASYIGFNFFSKSPRFVSSARAAELVELVPERVINVALTVNPDDEMLREITAAFSVDVLQLHGSESPERVHEIKLKFGIPVMKVLGIAEKSDIAAIDTYSEVADMLLVDAKPPKGSALPGGNAVTFDWRLIADLEWTVPWMLAGGLTPENVAEAGRLTGAPMVDVASGVESAPGVKDLDKIAAFVKAAKGAE
ncbi:MAG: phosphoribosylanthranilate isomerase [Paracoccaceae bacterium]|jgi:phosphoribosylanthranilate isomerase